MKPFSYLPIIGFAVVVLVYFPRVISTFYSNVANLAIQKIALTYGDVFTANAVEPVVAILQKAEWWWPSNPAVPEAYGRIYFISDKSQEAVSWFLKSQQLRPENIITKVELGNAYDKNGDHESAIQSWRSAGAGAYLINKGLSSDLNGDFSLASRWYALAVIVNPDLKRAVWYWDKGDPFTLANPDFEDFCDNRNFPCNWTLRNAGVYSVSPDIGYLTGSSVRICSQETGGYLYQRVNTLPLTAYTLSGWIKTSDLSIGASLIAWKFKSNEEFIEPITTEPIQGNTTWTEVNVNFSTGSEPEYVDIVVTSNGPGCSWFDHVKLAQDGKVP